MSPTIFNGTAEEEHQKLERLEQEIEELKRQTHSAPTLPERESQPPQQQPTSPPQEQSEAIADQPDESLTEAVDTNAEETDDGFGEMGLKRDPSDYSEVIRDRGASHNPFTSIGILPKNVSFADQRAQERILMVLRQDAIINVPWITIAIILFIIPFTVLRFFPLLDLMPGRFQFFTMIGWYLFTLSYVIQNFLSWYFNVYIITDERIVDMDFYSLIYRNISSTQIGRIEDMTATTKGVFGAIFDFGDVQIQTAAEEEQFEFENVSQPVTVTKFINELLVENQRERREREQRHV